MRISPDIYAAYDALTFISGGNALLAPFAPVKPPSFRGYPRLTAPNRGKTRLFAPNRAKNFSGGSRASIRACATETASHPQHPATGCTNSHQLAALAPTCAEKKFAGCRPGPPTRRTRPMRRRACRLASNCSSLHQLALTCAKKYFCGFAFIVPPSGGLRVLRGSVVGLHSPTPNPNLNRRAPLRPHADIANRKSSLVHRLALTPSNPTKVNVANCRRSKIRPKTYTLNLNTQLMERGQPVRFGVRPTSAAFAPVAPRIVQRTPSNHVTHLTHLTHVTHVTSAVSGSVNSVRSVLTSGFELVRGYPRLFEAIWGTRPHRGGRLNPSLTVAATAQQDRPRPSQRVSSKNFRAPDCNTQAHFSRPLRVLVGAWKLGFPSTLVGRMLMPWSLVILS